MRHLLRVGFLLVAVAFVVNGFGPASSGEIAAAARIHVEYVAPKNPDHQLLFAQLKERRSLEQVQAIFMPFRLPLDVTVRVIGCDGVSNAWYRLIDGRPTVTLCYEYLHEVWTHLPTMATQGELTPTDALEGQMLFAIAHEFGHLVFDVYHVPIFGREEDAADGFATYIMLQLRKDGPRLIAGAAWSYHAFIKNYRENPEETLPLAAFSSNHGQPEERFYNMQCIAYGSDETRFSGIVEKGFLPQSRARDCKYEYRVLQFAFQKMIAPHIDQKKATKVLAMDWLATATPPRPLR